MIEASMSPVFGVLLTMLWQESSTRRICDTFHSGFLLRSTACLAPRQAIKAQQRGSQISMIISKVSRGHTRDYLTVINSWLQTSMESILLPTSPALCNRWRPALSNGTHGWVLSTGSKTLLQCAGPVDGPSSTRSELGGYISALLLIRALSGFWGLRHRAKLYWYCDSKAVISRVKRYALRTSHCIKMPEDADLLSIIRSCHQDLKKNIRIHWVKGHQDTGGGRKDRYRLRQNSTSWQILSLVLTGKQSVSNHPPQRVTCLRKDVQSVSMVSA
jgi:ribonuclease HI